MIVSSGIEISLILATDICIRRMKKYNHLFFDLDGTLWDFEANSRDTQLEMFDKFSLHNIFDTKDEFIEIYKKYNDELWGEYRLGRIEKSKLKWYRFYLSLKEKNVDDESLARKLDDFYLSESPKKTRLIPCSTEVLNELRSRYSLHIITNGFNEVQFTKLENSKLKQFFSTIITSEDAGTLKPDIGIFQYALKKAGAGIAESIMIGDILEVDILGAKKSGMDQIYLNPGGNTHSETISFEISNLKELLEIL